MGKMNSGFTAYLAQKKAIKGKMATLPGAKQVDDKKKAEVNSPKEMMAKGKMMIKEGEMMMKKAKLMMK